jgi:hypothetical protein
MGSLGSAIAVNQHTSSNGQSDLRDNLPLDWHAIANRVLLFILLVILTCIGSLKVTSDDHLRVPWAEGVLPETCSILIATGQPCPSCGATRAVVSALRGEIARSRGFHSAGIAIAAMLLVNCAMRIAFLLPQLRSAGLDIIVSIGMMLVVIVLLN